MRVVGLMSGTSLDGIDAALVEVEGTGEADVRAKLVHFVTVPYDDARRETIHAAIVAGTAEALCGLHAGLGEWLAEAVVRVCAASDVDMASVDVVGSHGQTVWHRPPAPGRRGATLQLGDPATIAERTGIAVVSDFRTRDMAAGGQGAPLVPWVDRLLFSHPERARAMQNLGGIGNVTRIPRRGEEGPLLAFDTGPGNALIDAAVELATGGRLTFDRDGKLAARGRVDETLLADLLRHPFFAAGPPKSTGREEFGRPFVARLVEAVRPEGDEDWLELVATLTELTARSVADAYRRWVLPLGVDEVVVTGGGALNPTLLGRIRALLDPLPVVAGSDAGVHPEAKEAVAFALLAWAHLRGIPANVPAATGAAGPRVLGSLTPGARRG
jgi:anhydro-N-acetylmuramic acid kinase